jgi:hypothetical protein
MADPTTLSAESFRRVSIISGLEPTPKAFAKRYNVEPEDLFPPGSLGLENLKQTHVMTKEERYGSPADREFSITLPRPVL